MTIHNGKSDWRTKETFLLYQKKRADSAHHNSCPLCTAASIKEYEHWRVIQNDFPYDRIAKVHHMIVPKRHTVKESLSKEEWNELRELEKTELNEIYNVLMYAFPKAQSIPDHVHYHLLVPKDFE